MAYWSNVGRMKRWDGKERDGWLVSFGESSAAQHVVQYVTNTVQTIKKGHQLRTCTYVKGWRKPSLSCYLIDP